VLVCCAEAGAGGGRELLDATLDLLAALYDEAVVPVPQTEVTQHTNTHTHTHAHIYSHTHIHTYTHAHAHAHAPTHAHTHTHTHTYIHTHTHTYTYTHTRTHTYTYTHIHTLIPTHTQGGLGLCAGAAAWCAVETLKGRGGKVLMIESGLASRGIGTLASRSHHNRYSVTLNPLLCNIKTVNLKSF
jgi:hypothetical protein